MKVLILKDFPYAANGIKSERMITGNEYEIRDEFVPGLEAEGFVVVGLPASEDTPSYDKMGKAEFAALAEQRGIDIAKLKSKDAIALMVRFDTVQAAIAAKDYAVLTDEEVLHLAESLALGIPENAKREDVLLLINAAVQP